MKEQRWPGDYETIKQQFAHSKREEQMGMRDVNASYGNDYLTMEEKPSLDAYQMGELQSSWATQLDIVGRQPHSREYLECEQNCIRSRYLFGTQDGQTIDYAAGIHFGDTP